jgi:hypothetical protein
MQTGTSSGVALESSKSRSTEQCVRPEQELEPLQQ